MRNFILGFLTAVVLAAAGVGLYRPLLPGGDPCRACGPGTRCEAGRCLPEARPEPAPVAKKRHRPRGGGAAGGGAAGGGIAGGAEAEAEARDRPAVVLKPADLKPVSAGDNLNATEVIDLTKTESGDRELSQEDLDRVFHRVQGEVLACLDEARGEAALSGRMTVSFRVQRSGAVSGVRVEAPAYVMGRGLYGCVRPIVARLRFPLSSRGQVVTYPFALH